MTISEKIVSAIKDMESKIGRDSKHVYRNSETGDSLQGVSTVSNVIPKDWLSMWGAKECAKALGYSDYEGDTTEAEKVLAKIKTLDVKQYQALLKEAKGASGRKSKKAMVDGKEGHAWLEDFVKARINASTIPFLSVDSPLFRPIDQFLKWENENVDYWIASEALVCDLEHRYAGQLDAIAMLKNGKLCIVDFKFASHISEDYWLQTGGYAGTFEKYGILFDDRIIIRLPKTLEKDEWDPKTFKYYKVANDIEVQVVPTKYETDRDAFRHSLWIKGWCNYVVNLKK